MAETIWHGTALIRPGVLAFGGSIGATGVHAHHAVQVLCATTPVAVADSRGRRHRGTQIIIPVNEAHQIDAGSPVGTVVFLDNDTAAGRAADHRGRTHDWVTQPSGSTLFPGRPLIDQVDELIGTLLAPDEGGIAVAQRHPGVVAALELLPAVIPQGTVRTGDLAHRVGLSTSRLTHLFSRQVGLPLRRYVLWRRLIAAVGEVAAGADLTTAAYAAGFSDSAHLTRTCREIFGLAPSALSRHIRWDLDGA